MKALDQSDPRALLACRSSFPEKRCIEDGSYRDKSFWHKMAKSHIKMF